MIRGRSLDEAANLQYKTVATTQESLTRSNFLDQAVTTYNEQIGQVEVHDIPRDEGKDILVVASGAYYDDIATKVIPRSVDDIQKRVEKEVEGVPIVGITDLIITSKVGPWITDTKLKGKVPSEAEVERSIQLTTYAILNDVPRTSLLVVNGKGQTNVVKAPPKGPEDYRRVINFFQNTMVNIEKGIAVPAPPMAWWCSEKWCGYWEICPFGAAGRTGVRQQTNVFLAPSAQPTVDPVADERDADDVG